MDTERERVVVRRCDCRGRGSSDVCKDNLARCVAADGTEVGVMERRLNGLVERGMKIGLYGMRFVLGGRELGEDAGIPGHAKAIHIEETVASGDLGLGSGLCMNTWVVGEELWEVVFVDLLAKSMCRSCRKGSIGKYAQ